MRWKLLLEEFGIKTSHLKGIMNVVTNPLSKLDFVEDDKAAATLTGLLPHFPEIMCGEILSLEEEEFPLDLAVIHRYQPASRTAIYHLVNKVGFKTVMVDTLPIIHAHTDKTVIPEAHRGVVLNWYHYY